MWIPRPSRLALRPRFLNVRIHNQARPTLSGAAAPSAETVRGAFIRDLEARIAAPGEGDPPTDELLEALRLGRRLLAGREGR